MLLSLISFDDYGYGRDHDDYVLYDYDHDHDDVHGHDRVYVHLSDYVSSFYAHAYLFHHPLRIFVLFPLLPRQL